MNLIIINNVVVNAIDHEVIGMNISNSTKRHQQQGGSEG